MSKKIYFVLHTFSKSASGGVNRVISETANELAKDKKYDVNILSLSKVVGTAYPLHDNVKVHSLNIEKYATTQYKGFLKILWLVESYLKIIKFYYKNKTAATWNVTSPPLIFLFFFLLKKRNQYVYCEHTSPQGKKINSIFRKIKNIFLKRADLIISLNKSDQRFYQKQGLKSTLMYNGITFPELGNIKKNKYIIFVGRFEYEKDPLMALSIFFHSNLWQQGYKFKMFGYGKYHQEILDKIDELNIQNYVEIITNERDPQKIYKDASLLIMTSKYEGLPTVLIEAMSRGIPCFSYDCPSGPGEIIRDGVNGHLIENMDTQNFIQTLKDFQEASFSEEAIIKSVDSFNIKTTVKQWKELI